MLNHYKLLEECYNIAHEEKKEYLEKQPQYKQQNFYTSIISMCEKIINKKKINAQIMRDIISNETGIGLKTYTCQKIINKLNEVNNEF